MALEREIIRERPVRRTGVPGMTLVAGIIAIAAMILEIILAFRLALQFIYATSASGFANFIYTISRPEVSPFLGLFNNSINAPDWQTRAATIAAMIVYGIVAIILVGIFSALGRTRRV